MRKIEIKLSLLLISFLGLIQFGCGSETPFKRGANSIVTPPPPSPSRPPVAPLDENPQEDPQNSPENEFPPVTPDDEPPKPPVILELNQPYFDSKVRGLMEDSCTMCHDNPAPDYNVAITKVVYGKPEDSLLYLAGSGQILPGGWKHKNIWRNNPDNLEILKSWIMGAEL